ncbi:DUF503 domain-containing protein [Hazenella sp. IB182357]|uniref:DUF503 domain-containing protein n=1 Tax=Polycladospora coralii TaxID=2771432 RepID=A0A926NHK9_9BACL|nr:DUF503 domain-containing protein [Polycladospora coralii]MBS7530777.1 DUF503 domain-containing protein [Polycladospora coralii]
MYVGLLEVEGRIFASTSLKDKRRVILSAQTKIRQRFNLAVAEVGHENNRQMTLLAVVGVGSSKQVVEQELSRASTLLETTDGLDVFNNVITFL